MKRFRISHAAMVALLLVLVLVVVATVAIAQNSPTAAPNDVIAAQAAPPTPFIAIQPEAGFPLDPFVVSLQGGGTVAASTLSTECKGFVTAAPTVSFDFKGKADLLKAFTYSDGDMVLVVQTPDGKYVCADDTNAVLLDPTVAIAKPAQGVYNVWVGGIVAKNLVPGFLVLTTHDNVGAGGFSLAGLVKRPAAPDFVATRNRLVNAAKRLEQISAAVKAADALQAGGKAVVKDFTATGVLPAVELQTGDTLCGGLVHVAPNYAFDWTGAARPLNLYVEANGDTTLLVRTPDGRFLCADDADSTRNLNPLLAIPETDAGRYLVWVGRVDPAKPITGTLTLTEAAGAKPKVLTK